MLRAGRGDISRARSQEEHLTVPGSTKQQHLRPGEKEPRDHRAPIGGCWRRPTTSPQVTLSREGCEILETDREGAFSPGNSQRITGSGCSRPGLAEATRRRRPRRDEGPFPWDEDGAVTAAIAAGSRERGRKGNNRDVTGLQRLGTQPLPGRGWPGSYHTNCFGGPLAPQRMRVRSANGMAIRRKLVHAVCGVCPDFSTSHGRKTSECANSIAYPIRHSDAAVAATTNAHPERGRRAQPPRHSEQSHHSHENISAVEPKSPSLPTIPVYQTSSI